MKFIRNAFVTLVVGAVAFGAAPAAAGESGSGFGPGTMRDIAIGGRGSFGRHGRFGRHGSMGFGPGTMRDVVIGNRGSFDRRSFIGFGSGGLVDYVDHGSWRDRDPAFRHDRWSRHHGFFGHRWHDRAFDTFVGFGVGGGYVYYDYDRSYPYDHAYAPGPDERLGYGANAGSDYAAVPRSPSGCATEYAWDERRRDEVPVRVCRN